MNFQIEILAGIYDDTTVTDEFLQKEKNGKFEY